jgi:hypothetical protein
MACLQTIPEERLRIIDEHLMNIDANDAITNSNESTPTVSSPLVEDFTEAAINDLQNSVNGTELENDPHTRLLISLIAASTNYSSRPVVERIKALREMLVIRREIIKEIKKDQKKYTEMEHMFQELTENLFDFFKACQSNLCSKLTALELANNELKVIIDALYPEHQTTSTKSQPLKPLSKQDQHDLSLAVKTLEEIFKDISNVTNIRLEESETLKNRLDEFQKQQIQPEQQRVCKRLSFWKAHIPHVVGGTTAGAVVGGGVAGGLIGLPIAGAVGTVVIGTMVCPLGAVVGVCIAGGVILIGGLTLAILRWIKKSYLAEQNMILDWLNKLSDLVNSLVVTTEGVQNYIAKSKQCSTDLEKSLTALVNALKDERHRRIHAELCQKGVNFCQEVIDSIKELKAMNFDSDWNERTRTLFRQARTLSLR